MTRFALIVWIVTLITLSACADETPRSGRATPPPAQALTSPPAPSAPAPSAPAATRPVPLNRNGTVLIDREGKRLILKTRLVLTSGLLEMLLCKKQTKEHESILSIDADAAVIHAGLLALGAEPGSPAQFDPDFVPPQGPKIDIFVNWTDGQGKAHRVPAKTWIRHVIHRYHRFPLDPRPAGLMIPETSELKYDPVRKELLWFGPMTSAQRDTMLGWSTDVEYQKAIRKFFDLSQPRELEADWVFAGSGFFQQQDGTRYYMAEAGNVICVANFSDAMIDVSIESTASNEELLFEPFTERLPPAGTAVEVELIPALPAAPRPAAPVP